MQALAPYPSGRLLCGHEACLSRTLYGQLNLLLFFSLLTFFLFPFCYTDAGYSQRQRQNPGQRYACRHTGNEKTRRSANHEKGDYCPQDFSLGRCSVSIHCKPKGNKQQYHTRFHQITCLYFTYSLCLYHYNEIFKKCGRLQNDKSRSDAVSHVNFTPFQCPKVRTCSRAAPVFSAKKENRANPLA